jgi:hypothetical protein
MYETTTGIRRKNPGYAGVVAVTCLLASIVLAWAVARTSLVKASLEMMSPSPVTTGMTSNAAGESAAKSRAVASPAQSRSRETVRQ